MGIVGKSNPKGPSVFYNLNLTVYDVLFRLTPNQLDKPCQDSIARIRRCIESNDIAARRSLSSSARRRRDTKRTDLSATSLLAEKKMRKKEKSRALLVSPEESRDDEDVDDDDDDSVKYSFPSSRDLSYLITAVREHPRIGWSKLNEELYSQSVRRLCASWVPFFLYRILVPEVCRPLFDWIVERVDSRYTQYASPDDVSEFERYFFNVEVRRGSGVFFFFFFFFSKKVFLTRGFWFFFFLQQEITTQLRIVCEYASGAYSALLDLDTMSANSVLVRFRKP
jgi:hypothetical protein